MADEIDKVKLVLEADTASKDSALAASRKKTTEGLQSEVDAANKAETAITAAGKRQAVAAQLAAEKIAAARARAIESTRAQARADAEALASKQRTVQAEIALENRLAVARAGGNKRTVQRVGDAISTNSLSSRLVDAGVPATEARSRAEAHLADVIEARRGATVRATVATIASNVALFGSAVLTGLAVVIEKSLAYGDALQSAADKLGLTTTQLQIYRKLAEDAGATSEELDSAVSKLAVTLGRAASGGKEEQKLLAALGITAKNVGDALPQVADALAQIPDRAQRAAIETKLFGEAGDDLDKALSGGSAKIDEFGKSLQAAGRVLSPQDVATLADASSKFKAIKDTLSVEIASVVANNAGGIQKLGEALIFLAKAAAEVPTVLGAAYKAIQAATNTGAFLQQQINEQKAAEANVNTVAGNRPFTGGAARSKFYGAGKGGGVDTAALAKLFAPATPKGPKGPKDRSAEITKQFEQQLDQLRVQMLQAAASLATDAGERAAIERDILAAERKEKIDAINNSKDFTAARKKQLLAAVDSLYGDGTSSTTGTGPLGVAINRKQDDQDAKDAADIASARLDAEKDALGDQQALAKTAAEQRRIALRLLELDEERERIALRLIRDSKSSSPAQVDAANIGLQSIDARDASRRQAISDSTAGPGEAYLKTVNQSADQIAETFEGRAVDAVKEFNDQLGNSVTKALGLHGVLGDIVGDLVKIGIQSLITRPLANALFGGGEGGAIGGIAKSIGSLFGRAGGGPVRAGQVYRVNERGDEAFRPAQSGTIIPLGGSASSGGGSTTVINQSINVDGRNSVTPANFAEQIMDLADRRAAVRDARLAGNIRAAAPGQLQRYDELGTN